MPIYNKLVRDRIPEIIAKQGKKYSSSILSEKDYLKELKIKLQEEVDEFLESENDEELADILEVIFALAGAKGTSEESLLQIRLKKRQERGGFDRRLFLIEVIE